MFNLRDKGGNRGALCGINYKFRKFNDCRRGVDYVNINRIV